VRGHPTGEVLTGPDHHGLKKDEEKSGGRSGVAKLRVPQGKTLSNNTQIGGRPPLASRETRCAKRNLQPAWEGGPVLGPKKGPISEHADKPNDCKAEEKIQSALSLGEFGFIRSIGSCYQKSLGSGYKE